MPRPVFKLAKLADRDGDLTKEWYVYYYFQHPDTGDYERFRMKGGINRESTKTGRKKIAREIIAAINQLLHSGWNPFVNDFTLADTMQVGQLLSQCLEFKRQEVSDKTLNEYTNCIRRFEKWLEAQRINKLSCDLLTELHVRRYRDYLLGLGLQNKTVNFHLGSCQTIWKVANKRGIVTTDPFAKVEKLRVISTSRNTPLTNEELALVSKHLAERHPGLLLLCRFIYGSAVRPKECTGIKREHLNFDEGTLTIIAANAKNRRTQVVDLPTELADQLRPIIGHLAAGTYLFSGKDLQPGTKPVHRNRVSEAWKEQVRDGLGIDKDLYSLKHKGAIDLLHQGTDIKKIQAYMRHSSLAITDEYLKSLVGQRLDAVRDRSLPL